MVTSWWQLFSVLMGWMPLHFGSLHPPEKTRTNQKPDYELEQVSLWSFEGETEVWELKALKGTYDRPTGRFDGQKIEALFFDPSGDRVQVSCQSARSQKRQGGHILMEGDVHMQLPDGFSLKSHILIFDPNQHQFEIPSHDLAKGSGPFGEGTHLSFTSRGLLRTKKTHELHLQRQVSFRLFESNSQQETTVFSDQATLDMKQDRVSFHMNDALNYVEILQPDLYARGTRGHVAFSANDQTLQSWSLTGQVLIIETPNPASFRRVSSPKPTRYASAGRARYEAKSSMILLSEYPQLTDGEESFTGDQMHMHRKEKTVETLNMRGLSKVK
jgi:lipopolysaccharide export system protein LptA